MPSRADIEAAVRRATGDPDTGAVRAVTPAIVDAVDALCNPAPKGRGRGGAEAPETRVIEAEETR